MLQDPIWDLESIFAGGSRSTELAAFIRDLEVSLDRAEGEGLPLALDRTVHDRWTAAVETCFDLSARLGQARAFAGCLEAQDVNDETARLISGNLAVADARLDTLWTRLYALAAAQPDRAWKDLLGTAPLQPVAFGLNEGRDLARRRMAPDKEALATDLAADGYHAWGQLYNTLAGLKQVDFTENKAPRQKIPGPTPEYLYGPSGPFRSPAGLCGLQCGMGEPGPGGRHGPELPGRVPAFPSTGTGDGPRC